MLTWDVAYAPYVHSNNATGLAHLSLSPGVAWLYTPHPSSRLGVSLETGYAMFFVQSTPMNQDLSVALLRGKLFLSVFLTDVWSINFSVAGAGYLMTIDGKNTFKFRPEWTFGLQHLF